MTQVIFESPFGPLILIAHNSRLVYCNWLSEECTPKLNKLRKDLTCKAGSEEMPLLQKTIGQLQEYFAGKRREFSIRYELNGTPFQRKVWDTISKVRYGETISYKALATESGNERCARAVAGACGANPIAIIIPCHRIICRNGSVGGYTGGLEKKMALLRMESKHNT